MNLTATDYFALSPLLVLFGTGLLLLLAETLNTGNKRLSSSLAFSGLLVALYAAIIAPPSTNPLLTPWLTFDALTRIFSIVFISIGIGTLAVASSFFKRFQADRAEFYFLLLSSLFGLILLSAANDFLTLFLGLETLSIALYVLCSYMKKWTASHEAAFKYFLLGSISTSLLLFGIALIYGATGTTRFDLLTQSLNPYDHTLFIAGIALISISLLFKAAIVPFHVWAPDVYAGAPTPVTAFMAVGTKAGAFAAFIRLFLVTFTNVDPVWNQTIALVAIPTLIFANFVAMKQTELRRFFAYSGISHAGFLLIPLAAGTAGSIESMLFYIVVYTLATLGCFLCLSVIDDKPEGIQMDDIKGLFTTSPTIACIFSLCLLTLGGIPPTIGFFAKFYLLQVAYSAGYYALVVVGLLTTILAAFYYLRIVALLFAEKSEGASNYQKCLPATLTAAVASIAILVLSVYPGPLLELLKK
ncbi:MAG: NADH-quinone oxidoreductase subunit N [Chlamydiales bacterium]|nr:NADH-quinone oxidoreductase subunit N [Chlamydiales bacterium]